MRKILELKKEQRKKIVVYFGIVMMGMLCCPGCTIAPDKYNYFLVDVEIPQLKKDVAINIEDTLKLLGSSKKIEENELNDKLKQTSEAISEIVETGVEAETSSLEAQRKKIENSNKKPEELKKELQILKNTINKEKRKEYSLSSPYSLKQEGIIEKNDSFYVILNNIFVEENGDWWTEYAGVPFGITPGAEIAVVAIIDDGTTEEPLRMLIHYQKFVDDKIFLSFDSLPLYARSRFEGHYLKISLWVYDLDDAENALMAKYLNMASAVSSSVPNEYSQAFGILTSLGKLIIENNGDDILFRYDFALYPAETTSVPRVGRPILQEGTIALIGSDADEQLSYKDYMMDDRLHFFKKISQSSELEQRPQAVITVVKGDLGISPDSLKARLIAFDRLIRAEAEKKENPLAASIWSDAIGNLVRLQYLEKFNPKKPKTIYNVTQALSDKNFNENQKDMINLFINQQLIPTAATKDLIETARTTKTQKAWEDALNNRTLEYDRETGKIIVK